MKLYEKWRYALLCIGTLGLVFLFLQFHFNLFELPYFWDELGVYSRAAIHLYEHGPGILPSALPDELSRGHPILIPFLFSLVFKLFGCKVVVARLFAAFIFIVGMVFLYRIFFIKVKPSQAFLFTTLIAIQPCFLSQSVLLLPEMPLMVASMMALFYFLKGNYVGLTFSLVLALFIKESAIILPLVIYLVDLLNQKFKLRNAFFILVIPFGLIGSYFAIQYYQRGYVFYPLHTSLMKFDWYHIEERWLEFYYFVFESQGRYYLIFIWPIVFLLINMKSVFTKIKFTELRKISNDSNKLFVFCCLFILAGAGFSSLNYILGRYLIYIILFVYLGLIVVFNLNTKWRILNYFFLIYLAVSGLWYIQKTSYTDVDFSYVDHVKSCEKAIDYLNVQSNSYKKVAMGFPFNVCNWNSLSGYYKQLYFQQKDLKDSTEMINDFYVFTFPGNMDDTIKYKGYLKLHKQIKSGYAFVNIYTNK